jgi:hypothetical protein
MMKGRGRHADESDDDDDSNIEDFRDAPSLHSRHRRLQQLAKSRPGKLASSGLRKMAEFLGERGGAESLSDLPPIALVYLTTVWMPAQNTSKVGIRSLRELRTLATMTDHLARGEVLQALDVAMQRMKAVERSVEDEHWGNAQWLELIPRGQVGIATEEENYLAVKAEAQNLKQKDLSKKHMKTKDAANA